MKPLSFIGTGKMASSLISSIYEKGVAKEIIASGRNEDNLKKLKAKYNIKTTTSNAEAAKNSGIIFICVKPQDFYPVLNEIKNEIKNQLIVSIAAGLKTEKIEKILGRKRVIRVMPNINCLVGEMAAGFSKGKYATNKDVEEISKILESAGIAFLVKEDLLDAVSVISGAGPAFFAYFIKHIAEAGIKKGVPKDIAYKLAAKTALGTGKLLLEKGIMPDEIVSMVASKKGVTQEGLKVLEKRNVSKILKEMTDAAVKRSKELGK